MSSDELITTSRPNTVVLFLSVKIVPFVTL